MPPNTLDSLGTDPEMKAQNYQGKGVSQEPVESEDNYKLRIFQSSINLLAHILIGATIGIGFLYGFRAGLPLNATSLHLVLCIPGYQLLMAQAILSLSPGTDWSAKFRLVDKRRAHWILQLLGSGLAIAGSIIKILDKTVHWNTLHGQFALVALVFTVASLVNGLTSLWAYEWRKFFPMNLSKLTHICFGTVAFVAASISLCYGFEKNGFRNWATDAIAYTFIVFVAFFTCVVIINPFISFYSKSRGIFKTN